MNCLKNKIYHGIGLLKTAESEETLTNIFKRGSIPTIPTLEMICKGLNISLSEFFAEDDMIECSPELMELHDEWKFLTQKQKNLVLELIKEMRNKI